jgi:hypothetical protein
MFFFDRKLSYKIDDWNECLQKNKSADKTVKYFFFNEKAKKCLRVQKGSVSKSKISRPEKFMKSTHRIFQIARSGRCPIRKKSHHNFGGK